MKIVILDLIPVEWWDACTMPCGLAFILLYDCVAVHLSTFATKFNGKIRWNQSQIIPGERFLWCYDTFPSNKIVFLFASKLPQFCHSKWNLTAHTFIRSCTKLEIKVYHKLFTKVYSQLIFSKLQFFTSINFPKFTYANGRFFPYPVGWHWSKIYFT